ncbi:exonuclease mut-7-like protein [Platysternon megacephalum]|uniref:Exonuclease mut-7-like protein n=1 Tax=Platysternon megacephalum TaxID=55544 RepID=A0A4D9DW14_9SAUR|nr:exonuclease mut-7-like protein [Platysternon megacephalum]
MCHNSTQKNHFSGTSGRRIRTTHAPLQFRPPREALLTEPAPQQASPPKNPTSTRPCLPQSSSSSSPPLLRHEDPETRLRYTPWGSSLPIQRQRLDFLIAPRIRISSLLRGSLGKICI